MRIHFIQKLIDKIRNKKIINSDIESAYFRTKKLCQKRLEIENLYLGLSYGLYGINPKFLTTPSFNYCFPSMDLYTSYKTYLYINDFLPNLKNIFISCAFYSPGWNLNKATNAELQLKTYEFF